MKKEQRILCLILFVSILLNAFLFSNINHEMVFRTLENKEINMDEFRKMQISDSILSAIALFRSEETLEMAAGGMLLHNYNLRDISFQKLKKMLPKTERLGQINAVIKITDYYRQVLSDVEVFPLIYQESMKLNYENSWHENRNYGGKRFHEGTDLIPKEAVPGEHPVISMTDGVVEKMGWLDQGGYRIGIRSKSGAYFYYAHLDSYRKELASGAAVKAGDIIGYMGDTGYGKEGTTGQFPVHLHMGIYLMEKDSEISVNPYWILKWIEKNTNLEASVV